nr:hypothetical protein [Tanacetum cinerariifolium]
MFENTFNSELKECLQNYTAIEAYFVKYTIIDDKDFIKKYMLETILHQQEILQLLNEKKLQTQEVQSNTVQVSNVNSVIMENTSFGKEKTSANVAEFLKFPMASGVRIRRGIALRPDESKVSTAGEH